MIDDITFIYVLVELFPIINSDIFLGQDCFYTSSNREYKYSAALLARGLYVVNSANEQK